MDNGAWKGSPHANGGGYQLDTTYQPPIGLEDTYAPPAANDNPFASDNPFSQHDSNVPEVVPAVPAVPYTTYTAQPSVAPVAPVLQFQDSHLPTHSTTGRIGAAEVPRVQPYTGNQPLLGTSHPPLSGGPGPSGDPENGAKYSMFNLKRYRKYFNVDTEDVLSRMLDSVIGFIKADFLEKTTDSADLYGPFWVATTLVFVSAVTGNYANYVSYKAKHSQQPDAELPTWYYDVNKVGYSAILSMGTGGHWPPAVCLLEVVVKSSVQLAQVWCTYGYSLSLFIPISFFCIFPYEVARWILTMTATVVTGLFLMLNFRQPIFDVAGAKALPVWLLMGALHLGLGLVLKLYFFQYW